ncbi:hypothetical protein AVEN_275040-1 [Araneus ventricosus]|uniref:Uncharacterized protein n=1 Tax=Araneus ventricosus TaxID=182803 RepID=A0A4Y2ESV8_ARAVE|nr:hypothetical protein AVEN_275040-1 [Araneus ventricosus]
MPFSANQRCECHIGAIWLVFEHCPPKLHQLVQCTSGRALSWSKTTPEKNRPDRLAFLDCCTQTVQGDSNKLHSTTTHPLLQRRKSLQHLLPLKNE